MEHLDLRPEVDPVLLDHVQGSVAYGMKRYRELPIKQEILTEAYFILLSLKEVELASALMSASKRIGDKLLHGTESMPQ